MSDKSRQHLGPLCPSRPTVLISPRTRSPRQESRPEPCWRSCLACRGWGRGDPRSLWVLPILPFETGSLSVSLKRWLFSFPTLKEKVLWLPKLVVPLTPGAAFRKPR